MAASRTITISGTALADMTELQVRLGDPARVNRRIGQAVNRKVVDHLTAKEAEGNKNGWPSQHFYANAARATHFAADAKSVVISINWQGFRQRVEGGEIKPVNVKYLTIPARSEAYGRRAREFGNLVVVFGKQRDGGRGPVALAAGENGATLKVFRGREAAGAERPVKGADQGVILFWLVKSVTQKPDPTVLPSDDAINVVINQTVADYLDLTQRRQAA